MESQGDLANFQGHIQHGEEAESQASSVHRVAAAPAGQTSVPAQDGGQ